MVGDAADDVALEGSNTAADNDQLCHPLWSTRLNQRAQFVGDLVDE